MVNKDSFIGNFLKNVEDIMRIYERSVLFSYRIFK